MKLRLLSMQRSVRKITSGLLLATLVVIFLSLFLIPQPGLAQTSRTAGNLLDIQSAQGIGLGQTPLKIIIANVVRVILGFVGLVLVILIMYGGFVWMTASGDPDNINKAKKIITNAIIGLIIILSAFAIVSFVVNIFEGNEKPGGPGGIGGSGEPLVGLGSGPIESVFPAPFASEVAINTWIAVTFKENINPNTICVADEKVDGDPNQCEGETMRDNIEICKIIDGQPNGPCETVGDFTITSFASSVASNNAGDKRTFVFRPVKYLGLEDGLNRNFRVKLKQGIEKETGGSIFSDVIGDPSFTWRFTTNGELDIDPPEVMSTNVELNPAGVPSVSGVYPNPDSGADNYFSSQDASRGSTDVSFSNLPQAEVAPKINGVSYVGQPVTVPIDQVLSAGELVSPVNVEIRSDGFDFSSSGSVKFVINGSKAEFTDDSAILAGQSLDIVASQSIAIVDFGLNIYATNGIFPQGTTWQFDITASQTGDKITINDGADDYVYVFVENEETRQTIGGDYTVKIGHSTQASANNFGAAINSVGANNLVNAKSVSSFGGDWVVSLEAKTAGANGLTIAEDSGAISLSSSSLSGSDRLEGSSPVGVMDAYRNSAIQINFNEAINPLSISNIIVKYDQAGSYTGATPTVFFGGEDIPASDLRISVSNQYRTVEILGGIECGVNSCGDTIYCWPINKYADPESSDYDPTDFNHKATLFEVEIAAATLDTCANDSDCTVLNWGTCGSNSRCVKTIDSKQVFWPGISATGAIDGIVDMSANSLNGSFNSYTDSARDKVQGIADGQSGAGSGHSGRDPYILNLQNYTPSSPATGGYGDNMLWRFWVSDKIDLQSPLISQIDPTGDSSTSDLFKPILFTFDRLMQSSTIKPGWNYGQSGDDKARSLRYLVLGTVTPGTSQPGYWTSKVNGDRDGDNYPDYSIGRIEHSRLGQYASFSALGGSGLRSITQNCFLPGKGPEDAGSSVCHYKTNESNETEGCVGVELPNPASYAKTDCKDITGAVECAGGYYDCRVAYYKNGNGETYLPGSWIITNDYNTAIGGVTGCCFGVCEPVANSGTCGAIAGTEVCSIDQDCKDINYDASDPATYKEGQWIVTDSHATPDATGRTGCCYGVCIDQ